MISNENGSYSSHTSTSSGPNPDIDHAVSIARRPTVPSTRSGRRLPPRSHAGGCWYDGPKWSVFPPSTQIGSCARFRAMSARASTSAHPPSAVIEQSSRWNGSATIRLSRMSRTVNGPRPK